MTRKAMLRLWSVVLVLVCALLSATSDRAQSQAYPVRGVRLIVPFTAGGAPDVIARVLAQALSDQTGQSFVVENRPGADGVVGAQAVAQSTPDGYTLLVTSSSFAINPSFHKNLPFDVIRDFEPVSSIASIDAYILGINPALPAHSVQELVALASKPDAKISFASPGVGNSLHLAAELFKSLTKTHMVHVPYRGAAQALTGLIANDVQVMFMTPPASRPYIEGGKIRALGITSTKRLDWLPNVPTLAETGVAGMEVMASWTGLFAPAKTPSAVIGRLHEHLVQAMTQPVRDRLTALGVIPVGNPPAEFKPFVADQVRKIAEITRSAGIAPQ